MSSSTSRIIIAGGGSGGHIFPALAIAQGFVEEGFPATAITFFGSGRTLEKDIVPAHGYKLVTFPGRGLNRGDFFQNILNGVGLVIACIKAFFLLVRHRPSLVIGVGGYASLPALVAATLLGIKRVVHEQNAYVGRTNRIAQKMGAVMLTTFEATVGANNKSHHFGLPMLASIDDAIQEREKYMSAPHDRPTVLVAGGSLGSVVINETVVELVKKFGDDMDFDLVHICGKNHLDDVRTRYEKLGASNKVVLHSFRDDVMTLYARSSCVVSRAGAGTRVELETLGVDCILIPLPSAPGDHQRLNAAPLVKTGLCTIIDQNELTSTLLYEQITSTLKTRGQCQPNPYHRASRRRIADYLIESYGLVA